MVSTHSLDLPFKEGCNSIICVQAKHTQGTSRIWHVGYCLLNFGSIKLQHNELFAINTS